MIRFVCIYIHILLIEKDSTCLNLSLAVPRRKSLVTQQASGLTNNPELRLNHGVSKGGSR